MKKQTLKIAFLLLISISAIATISCGDDDNSVSPIIDAGNDPNFKIIVNSDQGLESFNRKVMVFDIPIYAVSKVDDDKLLHAANVLAQYLDNDEDGIIDDPKVIDAMVKNEAFVVMWKRESDLNINPPENRMGQDLGNNETVPSFVVNGCTGQFDATLEEILHIISNAGYASAYPDVFGTYAETELAKALDKARGGHFTSIPNQYPEGVWFKYDDNTCEYDCQATEYFYWAFTSYLGAQENRLGDIDNEWLLNTKEKVAETDTDITEIITNPEYKLPKVLPDGTYKR
ncbi:MAG: hypothetical protein JEY96_16065 [Bacteroidales bacterium]|nr:hypothetical protein [Bacteroidales bacterium]